MSDCHAPPHAELRNYTEAGAILLVGAREIIE